MRRKRKTSLTTEYQLCEQLCEILAKHAGERAYTHMHGMHGEGAVDVLCRIIRERDLAFEVLALDRLRG